MTGPVIVRREEREGYRTQERSKTPAVNISGAFVRCHCCLTSSYEYTGAGKKNRLCLRLAACLRVHISPCSVYAGSYRTIHRCSRRAGNIEASDSVVLPQNGEH